jgi:hypothetical protein
MKKYRCLWGKSTANHNIWYFLRTSSIGLQNRALDHEIRPISLWKAQNRLDRRGFAAPKNAPNPVQSPSARDCLPQNNPMPLPNAEQDAKSSAKPVPVVGVVENQARTPGWPSRVVSALQERPRHHEPHRAKQTDKWEPPHLPKKTPPISGGAFFN